MKVLILQAKPGNAIVKMINKHRVAKYHLHNRVTATGMAAPKHLRKEIRYTEKDWILADKLIENIFSTKKM